MLSNLEKAVLDRLIGGTNGLVDRKSQLIALSWAKERYPEVLQIVLARRTTYLNWLSINQRRWQSQTRNRRHPDSWALRESYVRVP